MALKKNGKYDPKFKTKVVLEVLKNDRTMAQIASQYETHAKNIQNWRNEFYENIDRVFDRDKDSSFYKAELDKKQKHIDELYRLNGKLNAQLEWAKKKSEGAIYGK